MLAPIVDNEPAVDRAITRHRRGVAIAAPEHLHINGHLVRSTHRYPGGPVVGYIVTHRRRRRLIVHVHVDPTDSRMNTPAKARRASERWARRRPTMWDELCAVGDRDGIPRSCSKWLAFVGRWPIVGNLRKRDWTFTFHRKSGLKPRPY